MIVIDCPEDRMESAVEFWSAALGRSTMPKRDPNAPYVGLETPHGSELNIFVQAIGSPESRLHFDIETDDVEAEVRRMERLGAHRQQHVQDYLWIMEAPSGHVFCIVPVQSEAWPAGAIEWAE
ncbi:MAG: VOC family protein [Chloroflexi bacterium]|nr:VOC family protein [Chloroflexota bacterium]